ncbi:MAG: hypothetical protein CR957_00255 [Gammaproteobacteria bacterium]|nr:MAG: hypothetical protein CR957_00255 [Gammaproteobacteria bacterium]
MSAIGFVVSPDLLPKQIIEWYRLNMRLQKRLELPIYLDIAESIPHFRTLCQTLPEVIYTTPFTAGKLMKAGYQPIAAPKNHSDEVLIFSRRQGIQQLEAVRAGVSVACLPNLDVQRIGCRLLEAVDIDDSNSDWRVYQQPQAVLRHVAQGNTELGVLPVHLFYDLALETQERYNILIVSALSVLRHLFLVRADTGDLADRLQQVLLQLSQDARYADLFLGINCEQGLEAISKEEALFMVDIVETLED